MEPIYHSSNLTLDELVSEIKGYQAGMSVRLIHLQGAQVQIPVKTDKKYNQATYVKKDSLDPEQDLLFKVIITEADYAQAASDAIAKKFNIPIFNELVFVNGNSVRVVGFGKI